jgi:hypothetical protein
VKPLVALWGLAVVTMLSIVRDASAQDDDDDAYADEDERRSTILDAVGPPTIPGLSHRDWAFSFEYLIASAEPTDVASFEPIEDDRAFAYTARWLLDVPLIERVWYLGATSEVGAASVPSGKSATSGGSTILLGNPELWTRALWSSDLGLAAGGGLGIVIPVPRTFSPLEAEVVRAIRVVRPESFTHFQDMALTARPYFDLRHVTGPVTLQMRQGIDISILLRDRDRDRENRYDLAAVATAYVGVRTFDELTLGLEVAEVYQITADTSAPSCIAPCDQHRVQVTIAPIVRLHLPRLSPSLSFIFPLSTPLRAEVASYYAARLHLDVLF